GRPHHLHSPTSRRGRTRRRSARRPREPGSHALDRVGAPRRHHGGDRARGGHPGGGARGPDRVSGLPGRSVLLRLPARCQGAGPDGGIVGRVIPLAVAGMAVVAVVDTCAILLILVLLRTTR